MTETTQNEAPFITDDRGIIYTYGTISLILLIIIIMVIKNKIRKKGDKNGNKKIRK